MVFFASFSVGEPTPAQSADELRSINRALVEIEGIEGRLETDPEAAPRKLVWRRQPSDFSLISVDVPFDLPGSAIALSAPGTFLVSGYDSLAGVGWLVYGLLDSSGSGQIQILEAKPSGIWDPWRIVYCPLEGCLYVWDYVGQQVLVATWEGPPAALPEAADYEFAAGTAEVPGLLKPGSFEMGNASPNSGVIILDLLQPLGTKSSPRVRLFRDDHGGWVTKHETLYVTDGLDAPAWYIRGRTKIGVQGPILVKSPGGAYVIRDMESQVIVHGGIAPVDPNWWKTDDADLSTWYEISPPAGALVPGIPYRVESGVNVLPSPIFYPIIRYGSSTGFIRNGIDYQLSRGKALPYLAHLGNDNFAVSAELRSGADATGVTIDTYLWVTVRPSADDPPIVPTGVGDSVILTEVDVALGPEPAEMEGMYCPHNPIFWFEIPDDPGLVGLVAYFQIIAAADSGELAITDVFGIQILPAGGQELSAGTLKMLRASAARANWAPRSDEEFRRRSAAARDWLRSGIAPRTMDRPSMLELYRHVIRTLAK